VVKIEELRCVAIMMLLGERGKHWEYFADCVSPEWWELRLWTRRN